ncbi:MAG: hypothetical protein CMM32_10300 [Rhodospirillaceae bacterium]|nr:hypothetical protein [Rhodospirillaceae bacterium]|tara:strand:+ start:238 stop:882 length:645 start_codon:yes stop_codon:yes gene_type:complete
MCGRYSLTSNTEALAAHFELQTTYTLKPRYNISPSQNCPIITQNKDNARQLQNMRWGLVPHWSKSLDPKFTLFNARSETIDSKPSFKYSFRHRHCLVPANGYYEWTTDPSGKTAHRITIKNEPIFAFAGLWDIWQEQNHTIYSFTIVTIPACSQLETLHHRMPAIIKPKYYSAWLANKENGLSEENDSVFTTTKLGTRVNDPRNDGPDLWLPQS